jgi:hypothetical protein
VLQRLRAEYSDNTVIASAVQVISSEHTTKSPINLDVHPLGELSILVVNIEVPISSKSEDLLLLP